MAEDGVGFWSAERASVHRGEDRHLERAERRDGVCGVCAYRLASSTPSSAAMFAPSPPRMVACAASVAITQRGRSLRGLCVLFDAVLVSFWVVRINDCQVDSRCMSSAVNP